MEYVRAAASEEVHRPLDRELYEWVRRAVGNRAGWKGVIEEQELHRIMQGWREDIQESLGEVSNMSIDELRAVVEEWGPTYLVCVDSLHEYGAE
jgi:hypothetical protein